MAASVLSQQTEQTAANHSAPGVGLTVGHVKTEHTGVWAGDWSEGLGGGTL